MSESVTPAAALAGTEPDPIAPPAGDARSAVMRAVDAMVAFLRADPMADDEAIVRHLIDKGLPEPQATKLIQFVPMRTSWPPTRP